MRDPGSVTQLRRGRVFGPSALTQNLISGAKWFRQRWDIRSGYGRLSENLSSEGSLRATKRQPSRPTGQRSNLIGSTTFLEPL